MNEYMNKIYAELKTQMSAWRYEHTMGVMYTAAALAMRYDVNIEKAMLAGLLHDCAKTKAYPPERLLNLCQEHGVPISESEAKKPDLLHAKAGAYLALQKYGVYDQEILQAISCHTTGRPNMTLLDKILYIADFIEPGRDEALNLPQVRKLAFVKLEDCLLRILEDSLVYLEKKKDIIDPMTSETYKYYIKQLKK